MFPEDFLGTIAFQAFGATIPANNLAERIQLENGIFLHALDEHTEAFLTLAQRLFRMPAIRNILEGNAHEIT